MVKKAQWLTRGVPLATPPPLYTSSDYQASMAAPVEETSDCCDSLATPSSQS